MQAMPEYGPERMGAPIQAFTRISEDPIEIHNNIENPSVVVVLDETLLTFVDGHAAGSPTTARSSSTRAARPSTLRAALGIDGGQRRLASTRPASRWRRSSATCPTRR